ncbi:UbiD family decarboxylase [Thermofilum pendens]|uniref:3-octaprenyl-4hydroxybenzoate decarboxylase n=1 Tax=Thermofilum pendens (strain DSM 2475 / Hrk 5) TaxID=368408 RepID=A1RWC1_THEPD|nr:UbiD family decarboxylase [Thermofilum pendens]ABL77501.1 3-octaprenyl-4hydroxybenzoate decarboxylase [Thermofilum pendens Hrk 5]
MSLKETLKLLESSDKLMRIGGELAPSIEIPWLSIQLSRETDKALLYDRVKGGALSLATNLFYGKLPLVLNAPSVERIIERAARVLHLLSTPAAQPTDKLGLLASLAWIADYYPTVKEAPGGAVRILQGYDVNLLEMPFLKHSREEEYPVLVNPIIVASSRATGDREIASQRVQVVDEKTMVLHVPRGSPLQFLIEKSSRSRSSLDVGILAGTVPALYPASLLTWLTPVDKILLAGVLSESKISVVKTEEGLVIPYPTEVAIIGELEPGDERPEGRMLYENGEVYGGSPMPVVHVKKILLSPSPVFYSSIIHPERSDVAQVYSLVASLLVLLMKSLAPEIQELRFLGHDAFRTVIAKVATHRRERLLSIGGEILFLSAAVNPYVDTVILVGPDVDVEDPTILAKVLLENVDPDRDIIHVDQADAELLPRSSRRGKVIVLANAPGARGASRVESKLEKTPESERLFLELTRKLRGSSS